MRSPNTGIVGRRAGVGSRRDQHAAAAADVAVEIAFE